MGEIVFSTRLHPNGQAQAIQGVEVIRNTLAILGQVLHRRSHTGKQLARTILPTTANTYITCLYVCAVYTHYILYRRAANIQYSPSDKKFKNFIEGKFTAGHLKSWQYRLKEQQYGHRNRLLLAGWLRVMVILVEMKKGYTDDDESIQFCLAHFDHQQTSIEESLSLYLF